MENSLKLNTRKTMLIFEREKDSLLQKANIYCNVSTDNPCIKYFTWTTASNIHNHLQDAFYDSAPAEKKVAFQEVTIIRMTVVLQSSPPLITMLCRCRSVSWKCLRNMVNTSSLFTSLQQQWPWVVFTATRWGGGALSQSMPLSNRQCQTTELKPERPAPGPQRKLSVLSKQPTHFTAAKTSSKLFDRFIPSLTLIFFRRNFKTKSLTCFFFLNFKSARGILYVHD